MAIQRTCTQCGKPFIVYQSEIDRGRGQTCSYTCRGLSRRGLPSAKRGRGRGKSYTYVMTPTGLRPEHHVIWEATHGRPIPPGHEVHHRNESFRDNSPDNLELLTKAAHRRLHHANSAGA